MCIWLHKTVDALESQREGNTHNNPTHPPPQTQNPLTHPASGSFAAARSLSRKTATTSNTGASVASLLLLLLLSPPPLGLVVLPSLVVLVVEGAPCLCFVFGSWWVCGLWVSVLCCAVWAFTYIYIHIINISTIIPPPPPLPPTQWPPPRPPPAPGT